MSKQKTPDLMDSLLDGVPKPKRKPTGAATREDRKLKMMSLRVPADWIMILAGHFTDKGLDLSSGLRLWIGERMEREGLK